MAAKRAAIACYASQLAPLQRDHLLAERLDANVPEQYWRLDPPPEGGRPSPRSMTRIELSPIAEPDKGIPR